MGSGLAPLQPQEVGDAALRLAFLAVASPDVRPPGLDDWLVTANGDGNQGGGNDSGAPSSLRIYDAVGPESMTMHDLLGRFARFQGNDSVCSSEPSHASAYLPACKTRYPSHTEEAA